MDAILFYSMGYQLNKPDLRREVSESISNLISVFSIWNETLICRAYFNVIALNQMEAECNLVANGRKRKEEIMQPILTKMSNCFTQVNTEAHKLDAAVARHFTQIGSSDVNSNVLFANFSHCGVCRNLMTLKQMHGQNQNNGTNNYSPKVLYCGSCSLGLVLPRGVPTPFIDPQSTQPFCCPICQYQVIKIGEGDGYTGNGYHLCPKCFSDGPTEYGGSSAGNFRCYQCTHQVCLNSFLICWYAPYFNSNNLNILCYLCRV